MNITREEKKAEAVRRMKLWGIYGPTREQFRKSNLVSISEPPMGACFWVNDEEKADIEAFEQEYDALVYHVVRSFTEFGIMSIDFDGTPKDFIVQFCSYCADFDPDDHAAFWVEQRGKNGTPSSVRDLIDDAEAIDDFLLDVMQQLATLPYGRPRRYAACITNQRP